jgi:hypothetical protein
MRKTFCLLVVGIVFFVHSAPASAEEMTGVILSGLAGIERGGGLIGGEIGYFFPRIGIQLDVAHGFDVAKKGTLRATTIMGNLVLTMPINSARTNYLYLVGGAGTVHFEGDNLPPFGGSATENAPAYGGGFGFAFFTNPHLAVLIDLRIIGFGALSNITLDERALGRFAVGLGWRF